MITHLLQLGKFELSNKTQVCLDNTCTCIVVTLWIKLYFCYMMLNVLKVTTNFVTKVVIVIASVVLIAVFSGYTNVNAFIVPVVPNQILSTTLSNKLYWTHPQSCRGRILYVSNDSNNNNNNNPTTVSSFPAIPTIEQLSNDPFMKQVSYADFIVNVLLPEDNNRQTDVVMKRLRAQLSHSDGIRGFMVSFLTSSTFSIDNDNNTSSAATTSTDNTIPAALLTAMIEIIVNINSNDDENKKKKQVDDLISLACMNVIMPTGMITMHTDVELSKQSHQTAQNAIILLKALYNQLQIIENNDSTTGTVSGKQESPAKLIIEQLDAILFVARSNSTTTTATEEYDNSEDKLILYWKDFFEKWGYKEQQRNDIAIAVENILR